MRNILDVDTDIRVKGLVYSRTRLDVGPPVDGGPYPNPIVYVDTVVDDPAALSVIPDDRQGRRLAVRHLVELGRTRIAHLTRPADWVSTRLRAEAIRDVLAAAGLGFPAYRLVHGEWSEASGYDDIAHLLDRDPDIDAVFAGDDRIARGVIDRLIRLGLRVPEPDEPSSAATTCGWSSTRPIRRFRRST